MAKTSSAKTERKRLQATYGSLCSKVFFEPMPGGNGCFYCGDHAETIDHCPPLTWVESKRMEDWRRSGVEFVLLPSCGDCNKRLGPKGLFTPMERVSFLRAKLDTLYEHKVTLWSDDEIAEMSPQFQKAIHARRDSLRHLLDRVRGLQWREMCPLD